MGYIRIFFSLLTLILCVSIGISSADDNSNIDKAIEMLDYSYANLRSVEKNVVECRNNHRKLEVEYLNLLSTEQLELYSKLEKAIIANSLVDMKLYSTKLFETQDDK